jgi:uncharacterized repeat protein (TIGR03803 family)
MKFYLLCIAALGIFFSGQSQVRFITSGYATGSGDAYNPSLVTVNTASSAATVRNFTITDPTTLSSLRAGADGKIYGLCLNGGSTNHGVVFSIEPDGNNFLILYHFSATGEIPLNTSLVFGPDGKLYTWMAGYLYAIDVTGGGALQVAALPGAGSLSVIDADGWIYALKNGNIACRIKTDGSGYQVLHNFSSPTDGDGLSSFSSSTDGKLYGIGARGGANGYGVLFSLQKDGSVFTVLRAFTASDPEYTAFGNQPVTDGRVPPLLHGGKIYFSTRSGGMANMGAFLSYDPLTDVLSNIHDIQPGEAGTAQCPLVVNGVLTGKNAAGMYSLHTDGSNFQQLNTVPAQPQLVYSAYAAKLYLVADGGLYKNNQLFQTAEAGTNAMDIHDFGNTPTGYLPDGVVKGADGKIYGILTKGGTEGGGRLYSMNANGSGYQVIYDFTGNGGQRPLGQLLYGADGRLYGVCTRSGISGLSENSVIYGVNTDGTGYSVLRIFNDATEGVLVPELAENTSGVLFGLTGIGGMSGGRPGKIFRMNKNGTGYSVLKTFSASLSEGDGPQQAPVAYNGFLYGTTAGGGAFNAGVVFRIKEDGIGFTKLKEFNGLDGGLSMAGLTLASNNKLYGTTWLGGGNFNGIVYTINPVDGSFQTLYNFNSATDGSSFTYGKFLQASDGRLYS